MIHFDSTLLLAQHYGGQFITEAQFATLIPEPTLLWFVRIGQILSGRRPAA